MKKAGRIVLLIAGILYEILGLLFVIIEARNLFSFDWLFYAHPAFGAFQALARLLAALLYVAAGILAFLVFSPKKEHPLITIYVDVFALATFFIGATAAGFLKEMAGPTPQYLSLPISLISGLYLLGAVLLYLSPYLRGGDSLPPAKENRL